MYLNHNLLGIWHDMQGCRSCHATEWILPFLSEKNKSDKKIKLKVYIGEIKCAR